MNNKRIKVSARWICKTLFVFSTFVIAEETKLDTNVNSQGVDEVETASSNAPSVVVIATRHSKDDALLNNFISIDELSFTPTSTTEMLANEAGLASNGQPGLFQTLNIRGLARHRVHTYLNGMRITSERRAGVAASFIDPSLLSGAAVTQGPASTYYGSGALAGTIHLVTRQQDSSWSQVGYKTDGNEYIFAGGSSDEKSLGGFAYRKRENGQTRDGQEKNDHFSQHSLFYQRSFSHAAYNLDWQFIESSGDDIGKDNLRYPESRITTYPDENHLLSQLTITGEGDWLSRIYFHSQKLVTKDVRPEKQINQVTNKSLDIGFSIENKWKKNDYNGLFGFDYFARRNVNSEEVETDLEDLSSQTYQSLENASENDLALFATLNKDFELFSIHSGLRTNYQSQKNRNTEQVSDDYFTYFLTAKKQIEAMELSLSYGTGFRFASLSERMFSGTTGRGQTIGNKLLKPEESSSVDLGVKYFQDRYTFEIHYFDTRISNFIETVKVDDDTRTYQNLTEGKIKGWQYQFDYVLNHNLNISLSGQRIDGHDLQGVKLSDIPADRHRVSINYAKEEWYSRLSYIHRLENLDAAEGEVPLSQADFTSFKFGYSLSHAWRIELGINNLFDEAYFNSADDLSTQATGRTLSINVHWN